MKVLITGGTGFIGRAIVGRLAAERHECIVVSRNPQRAATLGLPSGTSFLAGIEAAPPVDAVILLAGETVAGLWTKRKKAAMTASRVSGTRRAVDWMRTLPTPPQVLVSASAVGYYGHRPGEVLDESSGPDPAGGFTSRLCLQWEAEALRAEELGVRVVIPRLGYVLGPGGGILPQLLRPHRFGLSFVLGNRGTVVPWVALDDVVAFAARAVGEERLSGQMNLVAPVVTTQEDFAAALAESVGSRVRARIPASLLKLALGELSSGVLDDQHVVPRAALAAGFEFKETDLGLLLRRLARKP